MLSALWDSLLCAIGGTTPASSWEQEQQAWINGIRKQHPKVWSLLLARRTDSQAPRKILCVPASQSLYLWGDDAFSEKAAKEHILQPVSEKYCDTGDFMSLCGTKVRLSGNEDLVFAYLPARNSRTVRILRTCTVQLQNTEITLWYIDRPFVGGLPLDDDIRHRSACQTIALFRSYPCNEIVFSDVDLFMHDISLLQQARRSDGVHAFCKVVPSLQQCVQAVHRTTLTRLGWGPNTTHAHAHAHAHAGVMTEADAAQLEAACEEYLMGGIGKHVYNWILHEHQVTEYDKIHSSRYLAVLAGIRAAGWSALDNVPEALRCEQAAAVAEVKKLASAVTPIAKLAVLSRVLSMIAEAVTSHAAQKEQDHPMNPEFGTDNLIQILAYVVANAAPQYQALAADVRYIKEYHFAPCPSGGSREELTLCHYEAVQLWLLHKADSEQAATTQARGKAPGQ